MPHLHTQTAQQTPLPLFSDAYKASRSFGVDLTGSRAAALNDEPTSHMSETLNELRQALARSRSAQESARHYMTLGDALQSLGHKEQAMAAYGRAARLGQTPEALHTLAKLIESWVARASPASDFDIGSGPLKMRQMLRFHDITYSIIILSAEETNFLSAVQTYNALFKNENFEIIHAPATGHPGADFQAALTKSTADVVIFTRDNVEPLLSDTAQRLRKHLVLYDVVGLMGSSRLANSDWHQSGYLHTHGHSAYPDSQGGYTYELLHVAHPAEADIQALEGGFLAVRREVLKQIQMGSTPFDNHFYALDFTYSAHLAGFKLAVASDIVALFNEPARTGNSGLSARAAFEKKYARSLAPLSTQATPQPLTLNLPLREQLQTFNETLLAALSLRLPLIGFDEMGLA